MFKVEVSSNYICKFSETIAHLYICVTKIVSILEAHKESTFGRSRGDLYIDVSQPNRISTL